MVSTLETGGNEKQRKVKVPGFIARNGGDKKNKIYYHHEISCFRKAFLAFTPATCSES